MAVKKDNSEGLNKSEKYLGSLARRSFLSLWSHQNLYRGAGKELADLVVVCQNVVLIFSDKRVAFHADVKLEIAWQRWYNKAVLESVKQLNRAEGWISKHSDRIFSDARCENPVNLIESGLDLEIHKIAVANGAAAACLRHFSGGSGSLVVSPSEDAVKPEPFCVGNPSRSGDFVHVLDEGHLHIIMQELDTISDFVSYLRARRRLIANENLVLSASEEDLLALYLKDINEKGEHDFVVDSGKSLEAGQFIVVEEGSYKALRERKEYVSKKIADKVSYFWDHLIEKFARNFTEGTLAPIPERLGELDGRFGGAELALRYMALEHRLARRHHSEAILTAFDKLEETGSNRFFRAILDDKAQNETGFCVLLLNRSMVPKGASFEDYREFRCRTLSAYTLGLLERNRYLKRMVGIATEGEKSGPRTEDLIYHEPPEWTPDVVQYVRDMEDGFDIFRSDIQFERMSSLEYPSDVGVGPKVFQPIPYNFVERPEQTVVPRGNRHQRRAASARGRPKRR